MLVRVLDLFVCACACVKEWPNSLELRFRFRYMCCAWVYWCSCSCSTHNICGGERKKNTLRTRERQYAFIALVIQQILPNWIKSRKVIKIKTFFSFWSNGTFGIVHNFCNWLNFGSFITTRSVNFDNFSIQFFGVRASNARSCEPKTMDSFIALILSVHPIE